MTNDPMENHQKSAQQTRWEVDGKEANLYKSKTKEENNEKSKEHDPCICKRIIYLARQKTNNLPLGVYMQIAYR